MSAHTVLTAPKPALRAGARVAAGSSPTSASLRSKEAGSTTDAAHQRTGGQLAVHVATVSVSPPYRRHGPGCSQRCTACCLSVRVTVAALLFTRGVLCRGADHPRRLAPRQASAAASGAAAGDSQAPLACPAAELSRADFLHGADSSIYPGQAPAPAPRPHLRTDPVRTRCACSDQGAGSTQVVTGSTAVLFRHTIPF